MANFVKFHTGNPASPTLINPDLVTRLEATPSGRIHSLPFR
jgi:hypothetical protein